MPKKKLKRSLSTPVELESALDSIRPDGSSDVPVAPADIPQMLELAIERVRKAQDDMHRALARATDQLVSEAARSHELAEISRSLLQASANDARSDPASDHPSKPPSQAPGSGDG